MQHCGTWLRRHVKECGAVQYGSVSNLRILTGLDIMATSSRDDVSFMAAAVAMLVILQVIMLVYTARVTREVKLPLVLCLSQFSVSAFLSGLAALIREGSIPWPPGSIFKPLAALTFVWTAGFVLFNASATHMSPALVSLVRCMEPLATVIQYQLTSKPLS